MLFFKNFWYQIGLKKRNVPKFSQDKCYYQQKYNESTHIRYEIYHVIDGSLVDNSVHWSLIIDNKECACKIIINWSRGYGFGLEVRYVLDVVHFEGIVWS